MRPMFEASVNEFRRVGVAVVRRVVDAAECDRMGQLLEPLLTSGDRRRAGVRGVLSHVPELRRMLSSPAIAGLMRSAAGEEARVVRAIVFDKTAETNWMVAWHQDATIAVQERIDISGFGPWAVKDGEHHCQPPRDVMESIVTLRLHLDDCPIESGPLRVVSGSHVHGYLQESSLAAMAAGGEVITAVADTGDVVLTSPLAVHSSARSTNSRARRRVLHLDCTSATLPGGLRWAEAT